MQQRLRKYSRDQKSFAAVSSKEITEIGVGILAAIHDYRIIPASSLIELVPGHPKSILRQLTTLYRMHLVNRFCFLTGRNPSEFYYYLDSPDALTVLVEH